MKALLVRVGADLSSGGGSWNGPVDSDTGEFAYVAIPESHAVYHGLEKPYATLTPALARFGVTLPAHLLNRHMHLDPDFDHLTYGDQGERAKQLEQNLGQGDWIVFYAGLRDIRSPRNLIYALIGVMVVQDMILATKIPDRDRGISAHSRRILHKGDRDLIVIARPQGSGRLTRAIPVASYRNRAYRVYPSLMETWGGLSVKDGYLQRSARLPRFQQPDRFGHYVLD